jgi:hypothetical protein
MHRPCLFAHGLEGKPTGSKARYLESLGFDVIAPEMSSRGWRLSQMMEVLVSELERNPDIELVVGSSMGGLTAAVAALRFVERPLKLVLLAPAFGFHETFERMLGPEKMEEWRCRGTHDHYHQGLGEMVSLPYELWLEIREQAESLVLRHPSVIIHGLEDDLVAPEASLRLASRSPDVRRLVFCHDGHRLKDSLHLLGEAVDVLLG